jgi:hypothetical protein
MTVDELRSLISDHAIPGDAVVVVDYSEAVKVVYEPYPDSFYCCKPGSLEIA